MKKNLLMMLTCGRAAILTCGLTVTLLSACSSDNDKTETPQEQADVQMMYAVEVTDDVLKVASVEVNYVDQTGAKQKEVMTSTTWKKTLNAKTLPLTEGLWAKLTPKGVWLPGAPRVPRWALPSTRMAMPQRPQWTSAETATMMGMWWICL